MAARISLIIPFFNSEATLPACLESIDAQTIVPYETILVDDGSSDRGAELVERWLESHPGKLVRLEEGCVSRGRNVGLDHATGDWIAFLDADDALMPRAFEHLLEGALDDTGAQAADLVLTDHFVQPMGGSRRLVRSVDADRRLFGPGDRPQLFALTLSELGFSGRWYTGMLGSVWSKLYSASLASRLRFAEELPLREDTLFVLDAIASAECIAYVPQPSYVYFEREGSATRQRGLEPAVEEMRAFLGKVRAFVEAHPGSGLEPYYPLECVRAIAWSWRRGDRSPSSLERIACSEPFASGLAELDASMLSLRERIKVALYRLGAWRLLARLL